MDRDSDKVKDRLSNSEFENLIPILKLADHFFIEIKINGEWKQLFAASYRKPFSNHIECNLCNMKIDYGEFYHHIDLESHKNGFKKVEQYFHPAYTYPKYSIELAMGGEVSESEQRQAILEADKALPETFNSDVGAVKNFLTYIRKHSQLPAVIGLPINQLIGLEFTLDGNIWRPLLSCNRPFPNGLYTCNLCSIPCHGIITVSSHLGGNNHIKLQSDCVDLRSKVYKHLNKHCLIKYSNTYSLYVANEKRWAQVLESLQRSNPNDEPTNDKNGDENKVAEIQPLLKEVNVTIEDIEGLIGVEYVVKVVTDVTNELIHFECLLCEVVGLRSESMEHHLIGFEHRLKYCELHYADTTSQYKDTIGHTKYSIYSRVMNYVLHRFAAAIEKHHGRAEPLEVNEYKYNNERFDLITEVYDFPHASQKYGRSFKNIFSKKELEKLKYTNWTYNKMDILDSQKIRFLTPPEKDYMNGKMSTHLKKITAAKSLANQPQGKNAANKGNSQKPSGIPKAPNPPRLLADDAEEQINRRYNKYRQNPERHPLYDEEWNRFWRSRKDELNAQGIDHRSYNFQPEWVLFFKQRLEELYAEDLMRINRQSPPIMRNKRHFLNDEIDDTDSQKRFRRDEMMGSDFESMQYDSNSYDEQVEMQIPAVSDLPNFEVDKIHKPNIIHVLRLLTALEDHLGSLGVKVLDLLSSALSLEKTERNPQEFDRKLLTLSNRTLLETATEKLKGILYAGLLDKSKVPAFNKVISNTSMLLKYAEELDCQPNEYDQKHDEDDNDRKVYGKHQHRSSTSYESQPSAHKNLSDGLLELISKDQDRSMKSNNSYRSHGNGNDNGNGNGIGNIMMSTNNPNSYPNSNLNSNFNMKQFSQPNNFPNNFSNNFPNNNFPNNFPNNNFPNNFPNNSQNNYSNNVQREYNRFVGQTGVLERFSESSSIQQAGFSNSGRSYSGQRNMHK